MFFLSLLGGCDCLAQLLKLASLLEWLEENNFIVEVDGEKKINITKDKYMEFCLQFYPFARPMTEERRKRYEFLKEHYAALLAVGCDFSKLIVSREKRKQTEISFERLKARSIVSVRPGMRLRHC